MTAPRILFLYSSLGVGGAERQLALLAPRLRDRGFDPHVATLRIAGPNFDALRAAGIPTTHVAMRSRLDPWGALRAYQLWRLLPDVVFTQSVDCHVIGHTVARRAGATHIAAEHGGPGIRRRIDHRLATRLVARGTDRAVVVDDSQRPDLRQLGYRDAAIRVIPNGVPTPRVRRDRSTVRAEVGLSEDEVVAIIVAALRPEKRVDRFVEAALRAHALEPRIRALIVGAGPEHAEIRAAADESGGVVRMLGARTDVPDLMAASDVVCLSSDVEGLPMTVLEAMALSRPVIATRVGGVERAIEPAATGWLVSRDPDDMARCLVEVARDPQRAAAMGEAGLARYRVRYTLERMVDRYVELFTENLEHRRR